MSRNSTLFRNKSPTMCLEYWHFLGRKVPPPPPSRSTFSTLARHNGLRPLLLNTSSRYRGCLTQITSLNCFPKENDLVPNRYCTVAQNIRVICSVSCCCCCCVFAGNTHFGWLLGCSSFTAATQFSFLTLWWINIHLYFFNHKFLGKYLIIVYRNAKIAY